MYILYYSIYNYAPPVLVYMYIYISLSKSLELLQARSSSKNHRWTFFSSTSLRAAQKGSSQPRHDPAEDALRWEPLSLPGLVNVYRKSYWSHGPVEIVDLPLKIWWFSIVGIVGRWPAPLKNMTSSVGIMKFPTEWKNNPFTFQTTNQKLSEMASKVVVWFSSSWQWG